MRTLFPRKVFYFLATQTKKKHLLKLGIHGSPDKRELRKIMGKIRYYYFQNIENNSGISYSILMADHLSPFSDFIILSFLHVSHRTGKKFTKTFSVTCTSLNSILFVRDNTNIIFCIGLYIALCKMLPIPPVHRGTKALERLLGWI